jgi:hypothetical protein
MRSGPTERMSGVERFGNRQVNCLRAGVLDVGARGVEVHVAGDELAGSAQDGKEQVFGGSALVNGEDVAVAGQLAHSLFEAVVAAGAGVGFVPAEESSPLQVAHGGGAGIGEQVNEHILRTEPEDVVAGSAEELLPLFARGEADGFDNLDAEGLDGHSHGGSAVVERTAAKLADCKLGTDEQAHGRGLHRHAHEVLAGKLLHQPAELQFQQCRQHLLDG